jgi:hypothetical protein
MELGGGGWWFSQSAFCLAVDGGPEQPADHLREGLLRTQPPEPSQAPGCHVGNHTGTRPTFER